jgi:hypothetical protein
MSVSCLVLHLPSVPHLIFIHASSMLFIVSSLHRRYMERFSQFKYKWAPQNGLPTALLVWHLMHKFAPVDATSTRRIPDNRKWQFIVGGRRCFVMHNYRQLVKQNVAALLFPFATLPRWTVVCFIKGVKSQRTRLRNTNWSARDRWSYVTVRSKKRKRQFCTTGS